MDSMPPAQKVQSRRGSHLSETMAYNDRPGGGGGRDVPREMHDAVCADCGKKTQVPFKPSAGRPVYCRDCYPKHAPPRQPR